MKQCGKCREWKDESEFHKDKSTKDGLYNQCKVCKNQRTKAYQQSEEGKEYFRNWQKRFRQTEKGKKYLQEYRQSDRGKEVAKRFDQSEKGQAKRLRGRQSEKYKARHRIANARYRRKNPEKIKAQSAVRQAVVTGRLIRPTSLECAHCENMAIHYHHHKGYSKECWLDVIPICAKCHLAIHLNERNQRGPQRHNLSPQ